MRKYLLPSALILAFGIALSAAQNINKSVQTTQDPRGVIPMDSNNGIYFPGHQLTVGPNTPPTLSACGVSPTITGTDTAGTVTGGSGPVSACVVTFTQAYLATPYCVLEVQNPGTSPLAYTASTTAITIGGTNMGQATFNYFCTGSK